MLRDKPLTRDARILTTYVPGINPIDLSLLHPSAQVTGLFMQPGFSAAQREGRFRALPMSYSGFVRHLRENVEIDLAVVQVAAPDARGQCSLGPAVEFMPIALSKSRRRLGLVNSATPSLAGSIGVPYDSFDYLCEVDTPLPEYLTPVDSDTELLASRVATLIEDGCVLQLGLGKVPTRAHGIARHPAQAEDALGDAFRWISRFGGKRCARYGLSAYDLRTGGQPSLLRSGSRIHAAAHSGLRNHT